MIASSSRFTVGALVEYGDTRYRIEDVVDTPYQFALTLSRSDLVNGAARGTVVCIDSRATAAGVEVLDEGDEPVLVIDGRNILDPHQAEWRLPAAAPSVPTPRSNT